MLFALALLSCANKTPLGGPEPSIVPAWGIAEVAVVPGETAGSLWVWGRAEGELPEGMYVAWMASDPELTNGRGAVDVTPNPDRDGSFRVELQELPPGASLNVSFGDGFQVVDTRRIETRTLGRLDTRVEVAMPPADDAAEPLRFVWGGDLGGQGFCRPLDGGWPVIDAVLGLDPDVFIAAGDLIYADGRCDDTDPVGVPLALRDDGPAETLEAFRAHWHHNRSDAGLQRLMKSSHYLAAFDDHEVVNDFGPRRSMGGSGDPLFGLGVRAFRESNPVPWEGPLFRRLRWGRHAEVFVLDTRSYRSEAPLPDSEAKTMLGEAQRKWLESGVMGSNATWKVIVSPVPLSVPTGTNAAEKGRDGWASGDLESGYETELRGLLRSWADGGVRNLIVLTADVHFAAVQRLTPFEGTPDFTVIEAISGPMHAGTFPDETLDPTLNPERLVWWAPESAEAVSTPADFHRYMNVGVLDLDDQGRGSLRIVDANGQERGSVPLTPGR